ncbi:MAG: hypothetical protein ACI9BD_000843 [Candidatus Marinamargulisbacteria bacterium]|jgi:hypothetical protein
MRKKQIMLIHNVPILDAGRWELVFPEFGFVISASLKEAQIELSKRPIDLILIDNRVFDAGFSSFGKLLSSTYPEIGMMVVTKEQEKLLNISAIPIHGWLDYPLQPDQMWVQISAYFRGLGITIVEQGDDYLVPILE